MLTIELGKATVIHTHILHAYTCNVILNSINTKNMLYKIFIQADSQNVDTYNNFMLEYINYKATLRKSIRAAKRMYYLDCSHFTKMILKKPGA